ncbi:MAG: PRC-barrel domain-containing protein [Desulfobacterales bacterium]
MGGNYPSPAELRASRDKLATDFEITEESHPRSTREVSGYLIQAADGEIGHVEDFIVDDDTWRLRYIVVDTRNWLPGRKVLISTQWTTAIDWAEEKFWIDLSTDRIKNSPEYDPAEPINRENEAKLYDYYGRPVYWK